MGLVVLEAEAKFMQRKRNRVCLYVPAGLRKDSAWPFGPAERVNIRLDRKRKCLVVEKIRPESK